MSYRVTIHRKAKREIDALPADARRRVFVAIDALADDPRPRGVKKLRGRADWRIRVGSMRITYSIFDRDREIMVERVVRRTTTTHE